MNRIAALSSTYSKIKKIFQKRERPLPWLEIYRTCLDGGKTNY